MRCCTGRSIVVRQIESGNPFRINSDRFYLIRETSKGKRLVRNAKVKILNHSLTNRDIEINTNSHGFRYPELESPKPSNEKRILFLGDSVTLNNYLPEEETFTAIAEKILNQGNAQAKIKLINAGVEDIGINEELEILKEDGMKIEPDIVVVDFYLNDSRPPWGFDEELGHPDWIRQHSFLAEWIYKRFQLSNWFKQTGRQRMRWVNDQFKYKWWLTEEEFMKLAQSASDDWGAGWDDQTWTIVEEKFRELKDLSIVNNFKVIVIAFPVSFQLRTNFVDDYPQTKLKQLADSNDFAFLDLLPTLRDDYQVSHSRGQELYLDQAHLTTYGNELAGKKIAEFIRDFKL